MPGPREDLVAASQQLRPSRQKLKVDIEELKLELHESGLIIIPEVLPRNDALRAAEILRDLMRRRRITQTSICAASSITWNLLMMRSSFL